MNAISSSIPALPDVIYYPDFLDKEKAAVYLSALKELEFASETYTFQDKIIETKRKMSYHSEKTYTYSNQVYSGKVWTPELLELKNLIESFTGFDFNAVLVNHYQDGEAGMGWHADKEKELGNTPVIASLSLGQSRRFAFRHRRDIVDLKNPPRLAEYTLNSGDLLIMKGTTQKYFEHCVIKDKSAKELRINLTFRKVFTKKPGV